MNIGRILAEYHYITSDPPEYGSQPIGFVKKCQQEYLGEILPAVLKLMPEEFATAFTDNWNFADCILEEIRYNQITGSVTLILSDCIPRTEDEDFHWESYSIEFMDVFPFSINCDEKEYRLMKRSCNFFGLYLTFSSDKSKTKPFGKRPFRCNLLTHNRVDIEFVFSSLKYKELGTVPEYQHPFIF